jgi:hypothetical protein
MLALDVRSQNRTGISDRLVRCLQDGVLVRVRCAGYETAACGFDPSGHTILMNGQISRGAYDRKKPTRVRVDGSCSTA